MSSPWTVIAILSIAAVSLRLAHCNEDSYSDVKPCDSERCRLPYCYCANQTIPGGIPVRETPQFVRQMLDEDVLGDSVFVFEDCD